MIGNVTSGRSFSGLTRYMLADNHKPQMIGGNMLSQSPQALAAEFDQTRRLASHIRRPCMHISLSARPGEHLSSGQWRKITRDYLELMGIEPDNHQYVVVLHRDRDHEHVHIALCRVGIDGRIYHNHWDGPKTKAATTAIAQKYQLQPVPDRRRSQSDE